MNDLTFRSTLAFLVSLSLSGCALPGQRVGGECPIGETCSNETPQGLFFLGTSTADDIFHSGLAATAVGGTQTVTVLTDSGSASPPFEGAFTAMSAATDVFAVVSATPPSIDVRGAGPGTAFLRVLDPGTSALLDRVDVEVGAIDQATLYPLELALTVDPKMDPTWAILAGSSSDLMVMLQDAKGDRLIDTSLSLSATSGSAGKKAWDLYTIAAASPGDLSFEIQAGSASFDASAHVVSAIDDITPSMYLDAFAASGTTTIGVDSSSIGCFVARSAGTPTAGAAWTFTTTSGVEIDSKPGDVLGTSNCVLFKGTAVGTSTLTVSANGISKSFTIEVDPAVKAHKRRLTPAPGAPIAGERAGQSIEL